MSTVQGGTEPGEPAAPIDDQLADLDSRLMLEGLSDAVIVADEANRVVFVNRAGETLLGWPRQTLIGQPVTVLMPARFHDAHLTGFSRLLLTGEARLVGGPPARVPARHRDGTEREVELTLNCYDVPGRGQLFVASLRDLSDRVELERQRSVSAYLKATRDIATRLGLSGDILSVGDAGPMLLQAVGETLGWDLGVVWEVTGDRLHAVGSWSGDDWRAAAEAMATSHPVLAVGQGLPGSVVRSGESLWVEDLSSEDLYPRAGTARRFDLHTAFAFPIVSYGRVRGVAEFFTHERRVAEPALLAAMAVAGSQVGQFLERERARQEAAVARSHLVGLARALQASLLPPHPPDIPGARLGAAYHAAAGEGEIGGDFYDMFGLGDGSWVVAIGDVVGRGPDAAALTAFARHSLRAAAVAAPGPAATAAVVNEAILSHERPEVFFTAVFAVVRATDDGLAVVLANAGHPPPLLVSPDGSVSEAGHTDIAFGIDPRAVFTDQHFHLRPGEKLVLFTDGATEARDATGSFFGDDRVQGVVAAAAGLPAAEVAAALETAIRLHTGGSARDDLAVVVVESCP